MQTLFSAAFHQRRRLATNHKRSIPRLPCRIPSHRMWPPGGRQWQSPGRRRRYCSYTARQGIETFARQDQIGRHGIAAHTAEGVGGAACGHDDGESWITRSVAGNTWQRPLTNKFITITHLRPKRSMIGPAMKKVSNPMAELMVIKLAARVNGVSRVSLT